MVAATSLFDSAGPGFERLFTQEYARVVSVAYRITGDRDEAEDVAQEVFVRFARGRYERGWLYRAAVHTALNAVRGRTRRMAREGMEQRLQRSSHDAAAADPGSIVERRADAAMVRAALLRIGSAHAEILALRYAGFSYREIAQQIGIDAAQVGTRLARAERALRGEIERETLG